MAGLTGQGSMQRSAGGPQAADGQGKEGASPGGEGPPLCQDPRRRRQQRLHLLRRLWNGEQPCDSIPLRIDTSVMQLCFACEGTLTVDTCHRSQQPCTFSGNYGGTEGYGI